MLNFLRSIFEKVLDIYRRSGRFAVTVDPKVIELPQNRVDLVFEINEGDPTYVRKINFIGNKKYSDRKLRDVNGWFHVVLRMDTTQATNTDRMKLYINGVQETSFSSITYPNQNEDTDCNTTSFLASLTLPIPNLPEKFS